MRVDNPLVSIVIITYNSSKYIIETLESCKSQSYQNLELVISDDCSSDNTKELCEEWLKTNQSNFKKSKFIKTEVNSGIAPNLNNGIKNSTGDWIKIIAGDDLLMPDIIMDYVNYINSTKENIFFLHSNVIKFNENGIIRNTIDPNDFRINNIKITAAEQNEILLRSGPIYAATVMFHRMIINKVGYYNEKYPFWEDTPMWMRVTASGIKLHYLNTIGAKYRISNDSIQQTKNLFSRFSISKMQYQKHELLNLYSGKEKFFLRMRINLNLSLIYIFNNKRNYFSLGLKKLINKALKRHSVEK